MADGSVTADQVAELRATMLGPVLTPDGSGYEKASPFWVGDGVPSFDEARKIWNAIHDRRPSVLVQPMGVSDIQQALAFARANGLTVAVRGGGHTPSGASTIDGGLLIDMSRMRGVHVDAERRVAVAAGGSLLAELDRETQVHGLATTAGTVSHTGVAGLTLYGGVGRLMRKRGLTVDNVLGFNVVTADGRALRVDADNHPDLFWALRGGGPNFCIVTHFEYQLHPLGPLVYGGYLGWPLAQAKEAFLQIRDQVAAAPDDLQVQYIFVHAPVADFIPAVLQGEPCLMMTVTWVGEDLAAGERYIAPIRERVPATLDLVGQFPYAFLQSASDPLAPHGRLGVAAMCGYLDDLTEEIFDVGIAEAEKFPTSYCVVEFSQMGGAVSRVPADATAAGAFRDAGYLYIVAANTVNPDEVEACREWTFAASETMDGFRRPGRYLNFCSEDDEDVVREALGEETYARLADVKAKYDPDGVFSYNPNRRAVA